MKEAGGEIAHEIMTGGGDSRGRGERVVARQSAPHWRPERLYVSHTWSTRHGTVNKWHQLILFIVAHVTSECSLYFKTVLVYNISVSLVVKFDDVDED